MRKNSLSSQEAIELLTRLRDESTPVEFFFVTARRSEIRFRGFITDLTLDEGLFISQTKPAGGTFAVFPLTHDCEFASGVPDTHQASASFKYGNEAVLIRAVQTEESLIIFFDSETPVN